MSPKSPPNTILLNLSQTLQMALEHGLSQIESINISLIMLSKFTSTALKVSQFYLLLYSCPKTRQCCLWVEPSKTSLPQRFFHSPILSSCITIGAHIIIIPLQSYHLPTITTLPYPPTSYNIKYIQSLPFVEIRNCRNPQSPPSPDLTPPKLLTPHPLVHFSFVRPFGVDNPGDFSLPGTRQAAEPR